MNDSSDEKLDTCKQILFQGGTVASSNSQGLIARKTELTARTKLKSSYPVAPLVDPVTKKVMCTDCKRELPNIESFSVHYRIHTGEASFECRFCYQNFTQKGNRNQHERKYHEDEMANGIFPGEAVQPLNDNDSSPLVQSSQSSDSKNLSVNFLSVQARLEQTTSAAGVKNETGYAANQVKDEPGAPAAQFANFMTPGQLPSGFPQTMNFMQQAQLSSTPSMAPQLQAMPQPVGQQVTSFPHVPTNFLASLQMPSSMGNQLPSQLPGGLSFTLPNTDQSMLFNFSALGGAARPQQQQPSERPTDPAQAAMQVIQGIPNPANNVQKAKINPTAISAYPNFFNPMTMPIPANPSAPVLPTIPTLAPVAPLAAPNAQTQREPEKKVETKTEPLPVEAPSTSPSTTDSNQMPQGEKAAVFPWLQNQPVVQEEARTGFSNANQANAACSFLEPQKVSDETQRGWGSQGSDLLKQLLFSPGQFQDGQLINPENKDDEGSKVKRKNYSRPSFNIDATLPCLPERDRGGYLLPDDDDQQAAPQEQSIERDGMIIGGSRMRKASTFIDQNLANYDPFANPDWYMTADNGQKYFPCRFICGSKFTTKGNRYSHEKAMHGQVHPSHNFRGSRSAKETSFLSGMDDIHGCPSHVLQGVNGQALQIAGGPNLSEVDGKQDLFFLPGTNTFSNLEAQEVGSHSSNSPLPTVVTKTELKASSEFAQVPLLQNPLQPVQPAGMMNWTFDQQSLLPQVQPVTQQQMPLAPHLPASLPSLGALPEVQKQSDGPLKEVQASKNQSNLDLQQMQATLKQAIMTSDKLIPQQQQQLAFQQQQASLGSSPEFPGFAKFEASKKEQPNPMMNSSNAMLQRESSDQSLLPLDQNPFANERWNQIISGVGAQ